MAEEKVDLRAEPSLFSTAPMPLHAPVNYEPVLSPASLLPSGMSEVASNVSQITGRAYVPGASVEVLYENKIDLQPCCLQFSPTSREHLVVGTYNLEDPTTQSRNGSLLLYRLHDDKLLLLDTLVCPSGILDIRFNNPECQKVEKFAVASSSGSISIFTLKGTVVNGVDGAMGKIVHLNTFQVFPESIVVTSLAWHSSSNGPIAVSASDGKVSILNFRDDYTVLHQHAVINVHGNNEAWTVVFSMDMDHLYAGTDDAEVALCTHGPYCIHALHGPQANVQPSIDNEFQRFMSPKQGVYSGGDDSLLRFAMFSRNKEGRTVPDEPASDFQHARANGLGDHKAGVTAILPIPFNISSGEDILITGSYDDHVRVYAVYGRRYPVENRKPKVLAELNIGGGVWRLTFLEDYTQGVRRVEAYVTRELKETTFRILASCMQGGVRVLEVTGHSRGEWTIKVIAELKFNTTNDLVYAGDVQPAGGLAPNHPQDSSYNDDEEKFVFVSANFYEKQLCVWKYYKPASPLSPKTAYLLSREKLYGLNSTN